MKNHLKQIEDMSTLKVLLMLFCFSLSVQTYAAKEKEEIPKEDKWKKTLNDEFKKFILDIRDKYCKVKYDETTRAEYEDAYKAFQNLGYIVTKEETPGAEHLRNETTAYRPVLMRGKNNNTGKGHAWVCEGYLNKKYQAVISMIDAGGDGNPYFDYPLNVNPVNDEMYGEFFYMNFGWLEGKNNGWYRSNAYNPHDPDKSYVNDQKILLVRKP
jgi:hypothetical protein